MSACLTIFWEPLVNPTLVGCLSKWIGANKRILDAIWSVALVSIIQELESKVFKKESTWDTEVIPAKMSVIYNFE